MSSVYTRNTIKDFLEANAPSESVVDLTAQFGDIKDFLENEGLDPDSPWLGLRFVGYSELPWSLAATNDQGGYRESGAIFFDIVEVARLGVGATILNRGETLRDLLRGRNIGGVIIEEVTPVNTESGATLQFEAGYVSGTFNVSYIRDYNI